MGDPRNKLPRSVVVLNVIMIVIVLVICVLVVMLMNPQLTKAPEVEKTTSSSVSDDVGDGTSASTAATTTTPKSSVSMTKRSTEPTESVADPVEETEEPAVSVTEDNAPDTAYSRQNFENDLFIGDSITTGLYLYNKLDMKNVAASVGYTPYKAYTEPIDLADGTAATALEYAEKLQPKRIFIMLGSNGLVSAAAMEDSYRTLINKLSASCPDSMLYCISVSPVTTDSSLAASGGITNDMVTQFNSFIKSVCVEQGIPYIDFNSQITDANGYFLHDYAEADGLHFKGITYDLMLAYIENNYL